MARAESEEKKRLRKAKPAGKKVGWADRAGRTLQVVKEFHSEDAATAVSETPQESDSVVAATMASHHAGHRHWAERVKREREMERKFHGKSGGRSKSKPDHGRANAGDEEEEEAAGGVADAEAATAAAAVAAARKKRKPMVTTVPWRRPGPYEKGVVHEDVLQLEVESSEAESQGARTRAGLEQVYLSSGDIPSTPAEPDAASFLPVDEVQMYKIPFYMESELEQMQAEAPKEQQQQQPPANQPGPVKVTLQQVRALDDALASVDPHAATALRSRFASEPRLLSALLAPEGRVNNALLRSMSQQALSTPSNVHLTLPAGVPALQASPQYAPGPPQQLPPPPPPRPAQQQPPSSYAVPVVDTAGAPQQQQQLLPPA
ncbi:unnamed protein product, partial [Ectocarpus sp. 6 AP-2014]